MIFFNPIDKKTPCQRVLTILKGFALLLIIHFNVNAEPMQRFESAKNIKLAAKSFLEEMTNAADNPNIVIKINQLDPRLRLRHCANNLQSFLPRGSRKKGRVTVGVSCNAPVLWKLFVSASVNEFADVVVAKSNLTKKTMITAQDLEIRNMNISALRYQPVFNISQVVNTKSQRYIRSGSIVFEEHICMICRGDIVNVKAKNEYFSINMQAIALANANMGQIAMVRNTQSKRTFNAKVIGKDQLEVSLNNSH